MLRVSYRGAKRVVVFAVGGAVCLTGLVMLALPGPGLLVVFLGLTVLASEFAWARRWLRRLRVGIRLARRRARALRGARTPPPP